jgi:adenylate cyclase
MLESVLDPHSGDPTQPWDRLTNGSQIWLKALGSGVRSGYTRLGRSGTLEAHRVERKLSAIFAADVEGYSRLMGRDEVGTLRTLTAYRVIIDQLIASHRGRIFNTAGDSILADFASAVDAVECAVEVQGAVGKEDADRLADEQMHFRVGIHVGDIIVQGDNLFGDGVNIAARLEALAEPGGICVSGTVRDQIGTKLPLSFTDLGEQQVKNIVQPIRAYQVRGETSPTATPILGSSLPLPDKPSVAVLPFTNMSADPEQEFFADGIAEDVITALSRYPSLFVIARNSCFTYKGRAVDVKEVGRELGVRYVLEGSLRKARNRIRVTAQLVEAETGKHVWAERYDRDLADIFAVQDEIAEAVTVSIAPVIAEAERQRAMRKPPESLDAWAAYQRGLWHLSKATANDNTAAEKFFQQAIDLDSTFAGGYRALAEAQFYAAVAFQTRSFPEVQKSMEALAHRAIALDNGDAEAHSWLGETLLTLGDYEGALAETKRALAISPNLASAHGWLGVVLVYSGRPSEGLVNIRRYLRLDPRDPSIAILSMQAAVGHYLCRDYEAAVEAVKPVIRSYPDFPNPYRWLAAALGQLGRTNEGQQALDKAIAVLPEAFEMYVRTRPPWFRPEDHVHMLEGLRKAGWCET